MDSLQQLLQKAKACQVPLRYHAVSAFTIDKAQRLFGHVFCDDYHQFLRRFGFLHIHHHRILGLTQSAPSVHDKHSFLWATLQFRQRYFTDPRLSVVENNNNQWFFLLNHANGKLYGFDAIEAKYTKNYRPLLQPEPDNFTDYLHRFIENFLTD
ncbi:MAG: SMI1/KNR4 family protein [Pseudomonadota bacterium]